MRAAAVAVRGAFYGTLGLAALLLAAFVASGLWVGVAGIVGGSLVVPFVLASPPVALLGWLAAGPTLSGSVDAVLGGALPAVTPDRVLFLLIAAVAAARYVTTRGAGWLPLGRVEAAMLGFVGIAALSNIIAGGTRFSHQEGGLRRDFIFLVQGYAIPFCGFYLAKNLLREEAHARWVLRIVIGVGAFMAAVGLLQRFTGTTLFAPTRFEAIHEGRITGTLASAVEFGMMMTVSLVAATVSLLRRRAMGPRVLLLGVIALMLVAVVLAKTRAVWLGLVIALAIIARYEPRFRKPILSLGLVTGLAAVVAWPFLAGSEIIRYRLFDVEPIFNRVALTATSVNMIAHRPLFGAGFGRYRFIEEKWDYLTSFAGVSPQWAAAPGVPHNEFLHLLVLVGIVGFLPYAAALVIGWRRAARDYRSAAPPQGAAADVTLVFLAAWGLYVVNGMFADLMFFKDATNQVFVLMGAVEGWRLRRTPAEVGTA